MSRHTAPSDLDHGSERGDGSVVQSDPPRRRIRPEYLDRETIESVGRQALSDASDVDHYPDFFLGELLAELSPGERICKDRIEAVYHDCFLATEAGEPEILAALLEASPPPQRGQGRERRSSTLGREKVSVDELLEALGDAFAREAMEPRSETYRERLDRNIETMQRHAAEQLRKDESK